MYKAIIDEMHSRGMKFLLHSCGNIYEIIEDLIETGVDALQLEQPELVGVERLAGEFGDRVTFWCPVDIQKVMQTGDRLLNETEARQMVEVFKRFKGGFITKDYPSWEDIDVKDE